MKVSVKVKPNAKQNSVEQTETGEYLLRVKAKPQNGKANDAVISLLSDHFNIPRSRISILKGLTSRTKIIRIN